MDEKHVTPGAANTPEHPPDECCEANFDRLAADGPFAVDAGERFESEATADERSARVHAHNSLTHDVRSPDCAAPPRRLGSNNYDVSACAVDMPSLSKRKSSRRSLV